MTKTIKFQTAPHRRDYLLFYEYSHGNNGAGIGASYQTGWSGLVATLIELFRTLDAGRFLKLGKEVAFTRDGAAIKLPKQKIAKRR